MSTLTPLRRAILLIGGLLALGVITVAVVSIVDALGRTTTERDDTLAIRDDTLIVRNGSGPIDLVPSRDSAVHVHTTMEYGIFHPSVEITENSGTVSLRSDCRGSWLPMTKCEVRYRVEVPANIDLDVNATTGDISATGLTGKLNLHSTAGTISVDHITASKLNLSSNVGDINATVISAPTVTAKVTAGTISFDHVTTTSDLKLSSNVGDVNATDVNAPTVTATATAGTVTLRFDRAPDQTTVKTTVGDVAITLPPTAGGYDIRPHTNHGDQNIDQSIPLNHSGDHIVDATTSAGALSIDQATP